MNKLPSFTFVVPVRNESARIDACLQSIKGQDYPPELITIDLPDQASKDDTRERAARYGARITLNPAQRAIFSVPAACERATSDIIVFMAADNHVNSSYCRKVAAAFSEPHVSAVFNQVTTDKTGYALAVRYVNRFTDPFNHFIYGDACNPRDLSRDYQPLERRNGYSLYQFSPERPPMLSLAQGTAVRAPIRMDQQYPDDVGVVMDFIREGKTFAFIDEPLVDHYTARSLSDLLRKFRGIIGKNLARNSSLRWRDRYLPKDRRIRRTLWPFYACSIVAPVAVSLFRAIRDREPLWLYHPVMTWAFAWITASEAAKRLPDALNLLLSPMAPPPDEANVSRR